MSQILVIDDTKNIRKMVKLTLAQVGYDIAEAEDGSQGLERFGDGSAWDLTLIDQRMPSMEGLDVVREARRRDPAARLIMMTAFASSELAAQVLRLGALDFLRKPFSTATLRGAVQTALQLERKTTTPEAAAEIFSSQQVELPVPGQPEFSIPSLSYRINGFSFWPVQPLLASQKAPGMELGRVFQVRSPEGKYSHIFVGLTAHVKEQIIREIGEKINDDAPVWDKVCGQALLNFIWENSETPTSVLPIYEVPTDLQHKRLAEWMRKPL
jgi:CheY-like chemotaxis protein